MTLAEAQSFVQLAATVIGLCGGLVGLYKYLSDKREKELREWQKVIIYALCRQNENKALSFVDILAKYRTEAQAVIGVTPSRTEISENALRRILLELASSNILVMEPNDAFRLKISKEKPDPQEVLDHINQELVRIVGANPFTYTVEEVVKEISSQLGIAIPLIRTSLRQAIALGNFDIDKEDRIAFAK
jgi:hypothetical protein